VLVLQGDDEDLDRVAADPGFLMMMPFHGESRLRRKAPLAGAIMLATIVAASLDVPLEIAVLGGAAAMVLLRCLTIGQAYRGIDAKVFVFIAGAIPLGIAMEKTGTSTVVAGWLTTVLAGWSEMLVLGAIFTIVAVLTQFMSDAATTALFAPVAAALAQALGRPPEPYVVTVAMASVAAFLTPIGHHGNLLIYGPGRYRFADFVRVGTPLTILVGIVVVLLAPMLWRA
jgi:di/tricarboxylate transporter